MADVKGKFITLAGMLMTLYKKQQDESDKIIFEKTGKHFNELEQEGWYDTKLFDAFMENYAKGSLNGYKAVVTLGKKVYPTIKNTVGLPEFKTPLEAIKFEAEGFLANHRGNDVIPRSFVKTESNNVIVQAPAPGYNCILYEGVFLGILDMIGINTGTVKQTKCMKNGDSTCEFDIKW